MFKIIKRKISNLILFSLLILPFCAHGDTVKYSVTSVSWEPYWIIENGKVSGILSDFMKALSKHLEVKLEANQPLPVLRAQQWFSEGKVQIECCVNIAWRSKPEQVAVSLWSDVVMNVEEVLIFPPKRSFEFNKLSDLRGKIVSTIRGYGYVGSQYFKRDDSNDNIAQIRKVALGRNDAGIIDKVELAYLFQTSSELKNLGVQVQYGPVINQSELRIRVHKSHEELLEPINQAIAAMKQDGSIERMIKKYVN